MPFTRRNLLAAGIVAATGAVFGAAAVGQDEEKVIRITARKFTYEPAEITLKQGEAVVLELVTADVLMGFNAPDFKTRADIVPGKVARVRLTPEKTGTFEYFCDIFCGSGHEDMSGTIRVVA
jgi:cytochrome c oxidase subunit 2